MCRPCRCLASKWDTSRLRNVMVYGCEMLWLEEMKEINGSKCGFPLTSRRATTHLIELVEPEARTAASILSANRGRRRFTTAVGRGLARTRKCWAVQWAVQEFNKSMQKNSEGVSCQDCFVRGNFMPKEAQRLQHGSVRVLKDLTGYQIVGSFAGIKLGWDHVAFCQILSGCILWSRVVRFVERLRQ